MKILFLLHSYYKFNQGGAELQIKFIAEYLHQKGFEIHYIFLHKKSINTIDNNFKIYGIKKNQLGEKVLGKAFYYFKVLNKIKEIKPDVIYHRNLSTFALPIINYCKSHNCNSILHLAHIKDTENENIKLDKNIIHNLINKYGKKILIQNFSKIIAQAEYQNISLQKNFNRHTDLTIPNMHPYPIEEISKNNEIKVLWIANLKKWKQPDKFINLVKSINNSNVKFIMIGRDSNDESSKILKKTISMIDNLIYLGEIPINEVNKLLSQSHIFVNTSLSEGFPNTFIQAWMREVPVISLNVNPDNVLTINEIGFFSKTVEQMRIDLEKLINDKNLREKMGINSKKFANETYSLKNIEKIITLIKEFKC